MTLHDAHTIHLIGIKGSGMTALAEVLVGMGKKITGSDTSEVFFTDDVLRKAGISVIERFDPSNIPSDVDAVVYSTAYNPETNDELHIAIEKGIRVLSYPEALGELMKEKLGLAVCGTHGKTTTSALLAEVLREAGEDPLAVIGSRILQWKGNALVGKGKYFVLEADEYQNKLRYYFPFGVILTSVDWDHPDFFPSPDVYEKTFVDLVEKIPSQGVLVSYGDSVSVSKVSEKAHCKRLSYGFLENNDFQLVNYEISNISSHDFEPGTLRQSFEVLFQGTSLGTFSLQLAGRHNALNATAVIALCYFLKIDIEKVRVGLKNFQGTSRRFEYIGKYKGASVFDDYAHHPEEIRATLKAFRDLYPDRRLIALFHPHTFTRTKALLSEFSQSFDDADEVFILDIYGSAREQQGGVSSQDLVDLMNTYTRGKAAHVSDVDDALLEIKRKASDGDIVVTLGAGNVWEVAHSLVKDN